MRERELSPIRVALIGSTGRMGREVISALDSHPKLILGAALDRATIAEKSTAIALISSCDLIIDFSTASAQDLVTEILGGLNSEAMIPIVTGVTGLSLEQQAALKAYSNRAPVFQASNFSFGVALLKHLATLAARMLGEDFDAEIFELHHRNKLDAPSGTAISLAEAVVAGKRASGAERASYTLSASSPRDHSQVQISAGRGGGVYGDHSLFFLGEHERVELKHAALNRSVFAFGALRAAMWSLEQPPGYYQMEDLWER